MPLIDLHSPPSKSMLRWFGLSATIVIVLLGRLFASVAGGEAMVAAMVAALIFCLVYYLLPNTRPSIIRGWQRLTFPLAWVMGHVFLMTIYFGVLVPTALIIRSLGYDPLDQRRPWSSPASSWRDRPKAFRSSDSFRQY